MRELLFITATRADFGKLEPLATAAVDAGHSVEFFITGMHMMERYGETRIEVERIAEARRTEFINQLGGEKQDTILANTMAGLSRRLTKGKPDLMVIHGDRVEALAAALVTAMEYVRSIHIEGGEVSGTIDEVYRHCNTKLCTSHFVSSKAAKERVVRMGEDPRRVFVLGSPELDTHARPSGLKLGEVLDYYGIPYEDYGIAVFHSVVSEAAEAASQASDFFGALEASGKNFVVISPNNDPGCEGIFKVIDALPKNRFRVIPSMRFSYFSELLKGAKALVGNSSTGVREAPFLGLATLNIGSRQHNRSRSRSVTDVAPQDREKITDFLKNEWGRRYEPDFSFGNGGATVEFVNIINGKSLWNLPLQKIFHD